MTAWRCVLFAPVTASENYVTTVGMSTTSNASSFISTVTTIVNWVTTFVAGTTGDDEAELTSSASLLPSSSSPVPIVAVLPAVNRATSVTTDRIVTSATAVLTTAQSADGGGSTIYIIVGCSLATIPVLLLFCCLLQALIRSLCHHFATVSPSDDERYQYDDEGGHVNVIQPSLHGSFVHLPLTKGMMATAKGMPIQSDGSVATAVTASQAAK
jgi:hypothetical protein